MNIVKFTRTMAAIKTPISYLQEVCVKHLYTLPKYDLNEHSQEKMFECLVTACNYSANGVSSSKQHAKHKAAKELLDQLRKLETFKDILNEIPAVPQLENNNNIVNPVSNLLEICAKHNWDVPTFTLIGFTGTSNEPIFTMACAFKTFRAEGCASTKKDAKKESAKQMLEQIDHLLDDSQPPAEEKHFTIDEILTMYRKHHKWNRTSTTDALCERHFYFEKFSIYKKRAARTILHMNDSHREIVHAFCKALNIQYQLCDVPKRPHFKSFELLVERFDCIFLGEEPEIWHNIVDYFKAMTWAC